MLVFGLRPGEAISLQRRNIDLDGKILTVDKAITHKDNRPVLKETKTGVVRKIPIPDQMVPILRNYLKKNKSLFLFHMDDGTALPKSAFDTLRRHIRKATGVEDLYTFRHNRATELYYLCQKGTISTKKAAELMGHSEEIFLKIYSHVDEAKEETQKIYEDLVI